MLKNKKGGVRMDNKNIEDVMKSSSDLVEIVHTLKQILCVKG